MTLAQRIQARIEALGISQSELARRAGVPQTTVNSLVRGQRRSTPHIVRLAQVLQTTPAYLAGETDDASGDAPPPPAQQQALYHIMMPVALPTENALTRMYEGLLEVVDLSAPKAELARELAQLLPTGLMQLRGRLTELKPALPPRQEEVAAAVSSADRERQR